MSGRRFHRLQRSVALAGLLVVAFSGTAFADTVAADGDLVTPGPPGTVNLGTVAPGATITRDVAFQLVCGGLRHADPGQTVTVELASTTTPAEGGSVTATNANIGPVPADWTNDTAGIAGCPSAVVLDGTTPSLVTITAPTVPGLGYAFTLVYGKSLAPAGVADATSVNGFTAVTFTLDVAEVVADPDTTPPTLIGMPANLDLVTADPSGIAAAYTPPTATDDRDPQPAVSCDPAPGSMFPVGTTDVTCTATDASGNAATGEFSVTVHLATVAWDHPVRGADAGADADADVAATRGRSLPVKVRAWLDGVAVDGNASLLVSSWAALAADTTMSVVATWQADAGRWMAMLDTSALAVGCYRVELIANGRALGSFGLDVVAPPKPTTALGRAGNRPS